MTSSETQTLWSLALSGLMAPLLWFLRGSIEQGRINGEAIAALRVEIHRDFATKGHVDALLTHLEERFDRLEDKLDRLLLAKGAKQ